MIVSKQSLYRISLLKACQTVRRPPAYYSHLVSLEQTKKITGLTKDQEKQVETLLSKQVDLSFFLEPSKKNTKFLGFDGASEDGVSAEETMRDMTVLSTFSNLTSAEMSQLNVVPGDECDNPSMFPEGILDVNRQQLDLRTENSWTMRLHEVSAPELAEVMAINTMAPTIINSRLKELMHKDAKALKFIVNVSAMEGKFYRFKNETHPHTNMAKAALNMMTRTSAQDYVKSNIYMTSVDTGI